MKKQKGFTLIELLVVIAIIAILSTVVMAGLNSARSKGRDAKRLSDIKQLQAALELFYDTCGGYPSQLAGVITTTAGTNGTEFDARGLNPETAQANNSSTACGKKFGDFMNPLPLNPAPNGITYTYCSSNNGASGETVPTLTTVAAVRTATQAETNQDMNTFCSQSSSLAYRILFKLEGQAGSLSSGNHLATPGGLL